MFEDKRTGPSHVFFKKMVLKNMEGKFNDDKSAKAIDAFPKYSPNHS